MFEVRILIPVASNEGQKFSPSHHNLFELFVVERFGGITRYGSAEGAWVDNGQLFRDQTLVYAVAMKSIADGAKLAEVVEFAKSHYGQLAIYLTYLGQSEVL
jgi:hypothetical protein